MAPDARDFFKAISSDIARRLGRELTYSSEPIPPDFVEHLTSEQIAQLVMFQQLLVREMHIKKIRMIMRSVIFLAVLAAAVISDLPVLEVIAETFQKFLNVT